MKDLLLIDTSLLYANNSLEYALFPLENKKNSLQILLDKIDVLDFQKLILLHSEDNRYRDKIVSIAKSKNIEAYVSRIDVRNNQDLLNSLYIIAKERHIKNILLLYADSPFLDVNELQKLYRLHIDGYAEYTFGDNYAEGLVPEIMVFEFLEKIKEMPYKKPDVLSRKVFDCINADINKYFIEVEIAEKDFSLKRIQITASSKRDLEFIKRLRNYAGWHVDYITLFNTIESHPEVLHIFPKYVEIEITNNCNLNCIFCPRQKLSRKIENMEFSLFTKIIDELTEEYDDIIISFTLMGEPLLHPQFLGFVEYVMNSKIFNLIIETNGIVFNDKIIQKLSDYSIDRLTLLVGIDAITPGTYKRLRNSSDENDYYEIVKENIQKFLSYNEKNKLRTFVQILKINENKTEIEQFYQYWEKLIPNIVIQKYNNYLNLLDDRTIADLTPLDRFPCWHLQRDMEIFVNGDVPVCKQDINGKYIIGNLRNESIVQIWEKMLPFYIDNYKFNFKKLPDCKNCDEWYTYNF